MQTPGADTQGIRVVHPSRIRGEYSTFITFFYLLYSLLYNTVGVNENYVGGLITD